MRSLNLTYAAVRWFLRCSVYFKSSFLMSCCFTGCEESRKRKKKEKIQPPHSFQLVHYFGTAEVPTQLPPAKNTGSSGKKKPLHNTSSSSSEALL